ncbi:MAG: cytochrome d ubiquinol oxidase subunit II [Acidobacteriota bacterium]|nr:MAG: cytochrome d ubiquinol oxidase subunit II [Acidobacteriota bacterium]
MDLNIIWFGLLGVLLAGYAILDGFDLGVGILHPFVRNDTQRRILMNSIGPLWDGNEVWLVTFGGALFATMPHAYATAFSGFYLPFMLLLCALIFRAVSMEFRSKVEKAWWRKMWDYSFFAASFTATLLFGVAVGNSIRGLPIGADKEFAGTLIDLLNPYSLLVGLLAVALFAMHGSIFLYLKTEGELQQRVKGWMWTTFGIFMTVYVLTTIVTLVTLPQVTRNFETMPVAWVAVILNVLAVANIPRAIHLGKPFYAFASSAATIAALVFLFGMALFPNLIVSTIDPAYSLTIYNSASSQKTLGIALTFAVVGMPVVLAYTAIVYWVFRGKVKLGKFSY